MQQNVASYEHSVYPGPPLLDVDRERPDPSDPPAQEERKDRREVAERPAPLVAPVRSEDPEPSDPAERRDPPDLMVPL